MQDAWQFYYNFRPAGDWLLGPGSGKPTAGRSLQCNASPGRSLGTRRHGAEWEPKNSAEWVPKNSAEWVPKNSAEWEPGGRGVLGIFEKVPLFRLQWISHEIY